MINRIIIIIFIVLPFTLLGQERNWAIAIHGGAGNINRENTSDSVKYILALDSAISIGIDILAHGGKSIDAVEQVIKYLEDNPLFNAGKGAVLTNNRQAELDASIMDGINRNAGSIACVTNIKNPISLARAVMEKSEHVMLTGNGASQFAKENSFELIDNNYFIIPKRKDQLNNIIDKNGTVGCVALDIEGNLAAGTSTGGMMNKKYGRIGDSPIIGAGTYADNRSCAISCTGHGEFFIRTAVAFNIHSRVLYLNENINNAAKYVFNNELNTIGGTGGAIIVDKNGNIHFEFNTNGMFRAKAGKNISKSILLFK